MDLVLMQFLRTNKYGDFFVSMNMHIFPPFSKGKRQQFATVRIMVTLLCLFQSRNLKVSQYPSGPLGTSLPF